MIRRTCAAGNQGRVPEQSIPTAQIHPEALALAREAGMLVIPWLLLRRREPR